MSLYPLPSFLLKNQLAKEGPDSVAPVVIPALAPTLDKSLKDDRSIEPYATIWIGPQSLGRSKNWSDLEALTLHQVEAHDVRAFAASKAFQSGVFLEQLLSACHWKFHNTFTQFYLKDVAWYDSELFHLGPVVAA